MNAIILIGHGSLKSASGASMLRIAARLRTRSVADIAEAGFLNYSRPTMPDAVAKCVGNGATTITIQPYFLIAGYYVTHDLDQAVAALAEAHPGIAFRVAEAFQDHPVMPQLVLKNLRAADSSLGAERQSTALLMMAHGTPLAEANTPIYTVTQQVMAHTHYATSTVCFLDCNQPDIPSAVDQLVARGVQRIVAMPYFLQFGRHVREDLPRLIKEAGQRHPNVEIIQAHHLDYDMLLVDMIVDRVQAAPPIERMVSAMKTSNALSDPHTKIINNSQFTIDH